MSGSKNCGTFAQWNTVQQKERRSSYLCNSMDGTGEHYAKWNKPGGERQIPYDLTYKWNLISKTNKWAKYNQRHGNKEESDSNQRGGGRGITGKEGKGQVKEHIQRTLWAKTMGVGGELNVGSGGWVGQGRVMGGHGDKCNCTTIKK